MTGYKGVPTIRKRLIGSQLRRLREAAGVSVEAAAEKMGVGHSSLRRQESGHTAVSLSDARSYIDIYEVQDEVVANRLLDLARHGRTRGWWSAYDKTVGPDLVDVADAEDLAVDIKTFQPLLIPGIFQTREYTETVISLGRGLGLPVDDLVSLRERRKEILNRAQPPRIWAIIGEAALAQRVGGDDVMRDQTQHLLDLSQLPHVSIRVLPFSAGAHVGLSGGFVVMSFDDTLEGSITLMEGPSGDVFNDEPAEVGRTLLRHTHIQAQAMSADDTRRYLLETISAK